MPIANSQPTQSKSILDLGTLDGPILIFGGPYSNYQASEAIQRQAITRGIPPGNIICTGDLVAYCADPEATVNLIREWGIHVVMGNCEESIGNQQPDCGCGFEQDSLCSTLSLQWYAYANALISENNRAWMRQLPHQIRFSQQARRFAVIHGGTENISEFIFDSTAAAVKRREIKLLGVDCIVGGHCGIPFANTLGNRFWLNSGVIGMPANDGTRDSWYLILQQSDKAPKSLYATRHRLQFETTQAIAAMQKAGLGKDYQLALENGLWPSLDVLPQTEKNQRGKPIEALSVEIA